MIAGVFSAFFMLAVLVLLCHCYRQSHKLGKPSALPFKLRQQFRWDGPYARKDLGVPSRPQNPCGRVGGLVVMVLILGR